MNIKQKNIEIYRKNQDDYANRYAMFPARVGDIDRAFLLYKGEKNTADIKVLELGCCAGREYEYIQVKTKNYLWIDIQDKNIKRAQDLYGKHRFICADFESMEIQSEQDIIFAFASLLHCDFESMKNILLKLTDSLHSGGVLYISLKFGEKYSEHYEKTTGRIFYYYNPNELIQLLGGDFIVEYIDENRYNNQNWFTLAAIKK